MTRDRYTGKGQCRTGLFHERAKKLLAAGDGRAAGRLGVLLAVRARLHQFTDAMVWKRFWASEPQRLLHEFSTTAVRVLPGQTHEASTAPPRGPNCPPMTGITAVGRKQTKS